MQWPLFLTRKRTVLAAYYDAAECSWLRAEFQEGAWQLDALRTSPLPQGQWTIPKGAADILADAPKPWGLAIFAPDHYETRLARYPRALGRRLNKVLQYDIAEHALRNSDSLTFFHGAPVDDGNALTVPFFAMDKERHDALLASFQNAGLAKVHILPDATLIPALWRTLHPVWESGTLRRDRGTDAVGYTLNKNAVAEAVVLRPGSPLTALWEHKTRARAAYVPVHVVGGTDDAEATADELSPVAPPTPHAIESWPEEIIRHGLEAEPAEGFTGQARFTPKRPSAAAWAAAALVLIHILVFTATALYRDVQVTILDATSAAVAELREAWEPLEAQGTWLDKMQAMESTRAAMESGAVPLEPLLAALTRHTPKSTWLREMCLDGSQLRLSGEAPEALAYRNSLAELGCFRNVEFVGSITKGRNQSREQFALTLEVDADALRQLDTKRAAK